MRELRVATHSKRQVLDLTDQVANFLPTSGSGIAHVFVAHTTAAITTADLDLGTDLDLLEYTRALRCRTKSGGTHMIRVMRRTTCYHQL